MLLFLMYVQLRQNGPRARRHGAVPLPAAFLLAHAVSPPPKQCERHQKRLSDTLHFKSQQYLLVFDDTGEMQLGAGPSSH